MTISNFLVEEKPHRLQGVLGTTWEVEGSRTEAGGRSCPRLREGWAEWSPMLHMAGWQLCWPGAPVDVGASPEGAVTAASHLYPARGSQGRGCGEEHGESTVCCLWKS